MRTAATRYYILVLALSLEPRNHQKRNNDYQKNTSLARFKEPLDLCRFPHCISMMQCTTHDTMSLFLCRTSAIERISCIIFQFDASASETTAKQLRISSAHQASMYMDGIDSVDGLKGFTFSPSRPTQHCVARRSTIP